MADVVTKFEGKSRRLRERLKLTLPVRVYGRDRDRREWTEITRLIDVTPFGARFRLMRPTDIGRLLQLTLAMPRPLRVFDHVEDQYRVWSMVRHIRLLDQKTPKDSLVELGVAFIGRRPPPSYEENPTRRYGISQTQADSQLWTPEEASVEQLEPLETDDRRKESRQLIPIDVLVQVYDGDQLILAEQTVTENISRRGSAVLTGLNLEPDTFVKLSSQYFNTSVLAVVRATRTAADGIGRLHLELVGCEWPL